MTLYSLALGRYEEGVLLSSVYSSKHKKQQLCLYQLHPISSYYALKQIKLHPISSYYALKQIKHSTYDTNLKTKHNTRLQNTYNCHDWRFEGFFFGGGGYVVTPSNRRFEGTYCRQPHSPSFQKDKL